MTLLLYVSAPLPVSPFLSEFEILQSGTDSCAIRPFEETPFRSCLPEGLVSLPGRHIFLGCLGTQLSKAGDQSLTGYIAPPSPCTQATNHTSSTGVKSRALQSPVILPGPSRDGTHQHFSKRSGSCLVLPSRVTISVLDFVANNTWDGYFSTLTFTISGC
jgi:hypothetical protein